MWCGSRGQDMASGHQQTDGHAGVSWGFPGSAGLTNGFVGADLAGAALTAVLGQVAQKVIHAWEISAINQLFNYR